MLTGQPILAVCAGSWRLWETLGGRVHEVSDHCYSSMPYILNDGTIGNNKQVHRIELKPQSLVKQALQPDRNTQQPLASNPTVNSVHWLAPDEKTTPKNIAISARARPDSLIAPKNRQGREMECEEDTVEAFENISGSPVMGIGWHPESYHKNNPSREESRHLSLINYMRKPAMLIKPREKC